MKNLESQLQQFNSTILDLQARVELLEIRSSRNHEAIMAMDRKMDNSLEGLERRLDGAISQIKEEVGTQI